LAIVLDDSFIFTVTDLKQFDYCARVVFYERCLPHVRPRTHKMDAGHKAHEDEQGRARRRSLAGYGLPNGERHFDVPLQCNRLGLRGKLDELVIVPEGEMLPVDYKLGRKVEANHRLQLAAYALLLEAKYGVAVDRGFLFLIPLRKTVEVAIDAKLRAAVETRLKSLREMVERERMPEATQLRVRCFDCEFRRFCNDI
jgi:CRISPR-associated exonuclease Cas4